MLLSPPLIIFATLAYFCTTSDAQVTIRCGRVATPDEGYGVVSLQLYTMNANNKKSLSFQHICGGAIISPTFVLTAANCIKTAPDDAIFRIVSGVLNLNEKSKLRQDVHVSEKIIHPEYKGEKNPNDVALLRLAKPLNMDKQTKLIVLPKANSSVSRHALLPGWGSLYNSKNKIHSSRPEELRVFNASKYSEETCLIGLFRQELRFDVNSFSLTDNMCSADARPCTADNGGPLFQGGKLVGVVSWRITNGCGCQVDFIVYSQVSKYLTFIKKHVKDIP